MSELPDQLSGFHSDLRDAASRCPTCMVVISSAQPVDERVEEPTPERWEVLRLEPCGHTFAGMRATEEQAELMHRYLEQQL